MRSNIVSIFGILSFLLIPLFSIAAQTTDDQLQALQNKITQYQQKLNNLGVEKKTLNAAISSLTLTQQKLSTQIQVTQINIASTSRKIQNLSQSISDKEKSISSDRDAIGKALRTIAQSEQTSLFAQMISKNSLREAWQTADEVLQFDAALTADIARLQAAQISLNTDRTKVTETKKSLLSLQGDLSSQKSSVIATKAQQQDLLVQTKNQESNYQKLLAAAKAELAGYSTFTTNAGGTKLLSNQTSCDSWGCYYNQRDTLWGNIPLNGTQFRLASDGCLVTAMAMVLTHYGYRDVTPVTINSNPANFASYYPALLLFTIRVDGVTAVRKTAYIDATLSTGHPVVVGIHAYGGTHFVVLTSGSGGKYRMRDPYVENGKDIDFTSHYSVKSIFGVSKVIITS